MSQKLREGFLWGNSVSSMQTEGGWNEDGKGLSVYDIREAGEFASDWHFANDNYHHYEEDFDLMKDLGMNCYRFQISWSRVCPNGDGEFNEAGIAYYDRFIDDLIKRGIEPMICLYHFDMPLYLAENYDGFLSKHTVEAFVRYGVEMVKRFSHKVQYWITFNEQNLYHNDMAYRIGGVIKADKTRDHLYQIAHNIMMSHTGVANYIHEHTDAKIGGMLAYSEVYPATCHPKDILAARRIDEMSNYTLLDCFVHGHYSKAFMQELKRCKIDAKITEEELKELSKLRSDFIAFSYYASSTVSAKNITEDTPVEAYGLVGGQENPYIPSTEWKWQIDADGFRDVLNKVYQRYGLPIFPIENGIGVQEEWDGVHEIADDYRIDYHRNHIQALKDAIEIDGVDVIGYLGWGLIDILSSQGDMRKRYGVVYVNRTNHDLRDMKRIPKKSYHWLKKVIASNGEDLA